MDDSMDPGSGSGDGSGDDGSGDGSGTNAPAFTWPVALTNLTLVDPTNVPDSATFFLYQDQMYGDTPMPYPNNPYPQCDVYALPVDGYYLVDDSGIMRSRMSRIQAAASRRCRRTTPTGTCICKSWMSARAMRI